MNFITLDSPLVIFNLFLNDILYVLLICAIGGIFIWIFRQL